MPAPFGTVAPADAMRGAIEPAVTMTPAQRHVARAILGLHSGKIAHNSRVFVDAALHGKVAQELVAAGHATAESYSSGSTLFRLSRAAAEAALDASETLGRAEFPARTAVAARHPSNEF